MKFDFNDILIEPAVQTSIESRKTVNPRYHDGYLPIFTAPMDTVTSSANAELFKSCGIKVTLPRTEKFSFVSTDPFVFNSYGMDEFESIFITDSKLNVTGDRMFALIDIANGHMKRLAELVEKAKAIYGDRLVIMVGNVANPHTFKIISDAGADLVRIGIGNGGGCFPEGISVMTERGRVLIENVIVGDSVISHDGTYNKVSDKLTYMSNEEIVVINNDLKCTKSHEIFVINKKYKNNIENDSDIFKYGEWMEADKITTDFLLVEVE